MEEEVFYDYDDGHYKYKTPYGDLIISDYIPSSNVVGKYVWPNPYFKDMEEANTYSEKLDEILYDVLLDFSGSGIRMIYPENYIVSYQNSTIERLRTVSVEIVIEGSYKKTKIEYDPETHEINGFVWMSLGDRDLMEITQEETEIIRRHLLIWIYDNI